MPNSPTDSQHPSNRCKQKSETWPWLSTDSPILLLSHHQVTMQTQTWWHPSKRTKPRPNHRSTNKHLSTNSQTISTTKICTKEEDAEAEAAVEDEEDEAGEDAANRGTTK